MTYITTHFPCVQIKKGLRPTTKPCKASEIEHFISSVVGEIITDRQKSTTAKINKFKYMTFH